MYHIAFKKSIIIGVMGTIILAPILAWAKVPNDPSYDQQKTMWEQISAPAAWDITVGARPVVVAFIDTGADTWHQDLKVNIWVNPYEISDNGIDDDRNGYVDDINGWNFVENNNDVRTSVIGQAANDPEAVRHGTIIAGLIGAVGDNDRDGVGLNWRVQIMPLRAIDSNGSGAYNVVAQAVDYAVTKGASIIAMSFVGDDYDETLRASLRRAYDHGVVIVAAAGNNRQMGLGNTKNYPVYPACLDRGDTENWILSVASVNNQDQLSHFSNYGECVDLSAPGEDLASTERFAPLFGYDRDFGGGWDGTSFAAPLVAGTAALIKALHPEWGAKEINKVILDNVDKVVRGGDPANTLMPFGRLNVGKAVAASAQISSPGLGFDRLYSFNKNEIAYVSLAENKRYSWMRLNDAVIIDIAIGDINNDWQPEVAALIRRSDYYYVKIFKADGSKVSEFWLDPGPGQNKLTPRSLQITVNVAGDNAVVVWWSGVKSNQWRVYDVDGKQTRQWRLTQNYNNWTLGADGQSLVTASVDQKKLLTISQWNQKNKLQGRWTMAKVDSLLAMSSGKFLKWSDRQVVVLARQGQQITRNIVDVESGTSIKYLVGPWVAKAKNDWKLAVGDWNADGLQDGLVYRWSAGKYSAVSGTGVDLGQVSLPNN